MHRSWSQNHLIYHSSVDLVKFIQNPKFFGPNNQTATLIQTHISYVVLTDNFAFKFKKSINLGFLDFSTVEKRKFYCDEEVRLNKRLCPNLYLDVVPISLSEENQNSAKIVLNGTGIPVDYAIRMKKFPQEKIMTNLLKQNTITNDTLSSLCSILIKFYQNADQNKAISKFGKLEMFKLNIDENFAQTQNLVNICISNKTWQFIRNANESFLNDINTQRIFDKRILDSKIKDCHGDLHSGNIVVESSGIHIFDCIEFNSRFRYCDILCDISFLAMDLDYLNRPYLSCHFIQQYILQSGDSFPFPLFNFFKSYRAFIRGKVIGFQIQDPLISVFQKKILIQNASNYFSLSEYYSKLFSMKKRLKESENEDTSSLIIFIVCGLSGSGKSTISSKISIDFDASYFNTDIIRKQNIGVNPLERHITRINSGLYDPANVSKNYQDLFDTSEAYLAMSKNVVLDGTFSRKSFRKLAESLSVKYRARLLYIYCSCSEDLVKLRLNNRLKTQSVSDARWEVYLAQKKSYEPLETKFPVFTIDTGCSSSDYQNSFFSQIADHLCSNETFWENRDTETAQDLQVTTEIHKS